MFLEMSKLLLLSFVLQRMRNTENVNAYVNVKLIHWLMLDIYRVMLMLFTDIDYNVMALSAVTVKLRV